MSDACTKVKGRLKNKQTSKQTKNNSNKKKYMLTNIHCNHEKLISYFINTSFSFTKKTLQRELCDTVLWLTVSIRLHSYDQLHLLKTGSESDIYK